MHHIEHITICRLVYCAIRIGKLCDAGKAKISIIIKNDTIMNRKNISGMIPFLNATGSIIEEYFKAERSK